MTIFFQIFLTRFFFQISYPSAKNNNFLTIFLVRGVVYLVRALYSIIHARIDLSIKLFMKSIFIF